MTVFVCVVCVVVVCVCLFVACVGTGPAAKFDSDWLMESSAVVNRYFPFMFLF